MPMPLLEPERVLPCLAAAQTFRNARTTRRWGGSEGGFDADVHGARIAGVVTVAHAVLAQGVVRQAGQSAGGHRRGIFVRFASAPAVRY